MVDADVGGDASAALRCPCLRLTVARLAACDAVAVVHGSTADAVRGRLGAGLPPGGCSGLHGQGLLRRTERVGPGTRPSPSTSAPVRTSTPTHHHVEESA